MNSRVRSVVSTLIAIISIILQPLATLTPLTSNQRLFAPVARAEDSVTNSLFLPLIFTKPGPPAFVISTPANGATIAGTLRVAIQSTDGQPINSITFKAGSTVLATDTTPADGFHTFLTARTLPAGALTLSATAQSAGGESSQAIAVTVLPDPPSSGPVNSDGSGIFDSQLGSVITLRPGSAPPGTQVTVTELSQAEVTAQHKIDWDAIGVTFLGAQAVESSAPLGEPFAGVSSAGFGNRVQPGQAVVNYRLAPDADGDGASEVVVVNTASVAPNGDVVADLVETPSIRTVQIWQRDGTIQNIAPATGVSGPPGTVVSLTTTGLNPLSLQGNIAIFHTTTGDITREMTATVSTDPAAPTQQTVLIALPVLPEGPATLQLINKSTGYATNMLPLTVTALTLLSESSESYLDKFFANLQSKLESLKVAGNTPDILRYNNLLAQKIELVVQAHTQLAAGFQQISELQSPTEKAAILNELARVAAAIDNAWLSHQSLTASLTKSATAICDRALQKQLENISDMLKFAGPMLGFVGLLLPQAKIGVAAAGAALGLTGLALDYLRKQCGDECKPAQNGPRGPTGMGSAPPPGGNSCGGAQGGSGAHLQSAGVTGEQSLAGQIAVKVYLNGKATPFTGVTDAGGYFFIPFIPEGEPFTAVAYDSASGQTRNFTGIGPQTGASIYMYFDFATGDDATVVRWDGGGDGQSWHDARNWDGDTLPIDLSRVVIDNAPGRTVIITGSVEIGSLQSAAPLALSSQSRFSLLNSSSITNGITFQADAQLIAHGDNVVVTVAGPALTLPAKSALVADGAGAAINLGNTPLTLTPGSALAAYGANAAILSTGALTLHGAGLYAGDGGQLLLPQATTYDGNIRSLDVDKYWVRYEVEERCRSSVNGVSDICAVGSGSRIDLHGITTLIGETWTGFFGSVAYLGIRANDGGQIDLSNLQTISEGRIAALARGDGSQLKLPNLQAGGDRSYFLSAEQGTLDIRNLTNLTTATLDIDNSTALPTSQITNLTNAIVYVNQSTPDFAKVTNVNGSTFHATGGGQIMLPQIVEYASDGRDFFTTIDAVGAGSLVAFPALTTLTGNEFVNDALTLAVKEGGQIKMPQLTVIVGGKVQMTAEDTGSLLDLPLLNTFLRGGRGESWLKAERGGKIATPLLTTLNGVSLYFSSNGTLDSAQISSFTNGLVDTTGVTPNVSGLTHIKGSSFVAHNGGQVVLSTITAYDATSDEIFPTLRAEGTGSLVDFSTITAFTGQTNIGDALVEAKAGGVVRLNHVTTINTGSVQVLAEGAAARVELTALTGLNTGEASRRSALTVRQGGAIDLNGNTLMVKASDIAVDKTSALLVGAVQVEQNSRVFGNGAFPSTLVLNGSTLWPGDSTAGKMAIGGHYTQDGASTLLIDVGGSQPGVTYDQVAITGNAVLSGTLQINLLNGYVPPLNSTFPILTAAAVSGIFSTINGADIGNGRQFTVLYTNNEVTLQVVAAP